MIKELINIAAIITAPIIAVQIQKWIERLRENKIRKVNLFKTLMTTRASRVSIEHVQALNMIDVEFSDRKYKNVINAWRTYQDHLSNENPETQTWGDKKDELFIELLFIMGDSLGYKFDKVMLKRTAYTPVAHGDMEHEQQLIRQGLSKILSGNASFPISFVEKENNDKTSK